MSRLLVAVTAALASLALAACGGDEDEGPSKAEFIQKADAICAKSDREADAIAKRSFENLRKPKPEEAQAAVRDALPGLKESVGELRALERPEGDDQTIEEYIVAVEKGITTLETAGADPQLSLEVLVSGDQTFAEANELATEYGMKDCGE